MANIDFNKSATKIVDLVGGKDNISHVTHCITRVRFQLKDRTVASEHKEEIEKVEGVIQVVEAGEQYQVVIGPKVAEMYQEVVKIIGPIEQLESETTKEKKGFAGAIMKTISGTFLPVMPILVGCGLITALCTILTVSGLIDASGTTAMLLTGLGNAGIYFLPIVIGYSAAVNFKMDGYIGAAIGAAMIHPKFTAAMGTSGKFLGFIPVSFMDYSSTIFPIIVTVWLASYLYKFLKKHMPSVIAYFMVPFVTILISALVAIIAIGPAITLLSFGISQACNAVYNFSPVLCGAILGGTWLLFIVPLGLHWGFIAIFLNNIATLGYEPMMGLLGGIMTLCGTLLAVALKTKNSETKALATSSALMNFFGISEPGLYGIVLQHKETIIATAIGGAVSGIILAIAKTSVYVVGAASGIFGMAAYINPTGDMTGFIGAIVSNIVGFIVCFAVTMLWKFDVDKVKK